MSDYTPTTDEVREVWQFDQQEVDMEGWVTVSLDEAGGQFDRWHAAYTAEVAERIAQAIERRKRDMAEGYTDTARAMLEAGMEEAARIAREAGK